MRACPRRAVVLLLWGSAWALLSSTVALASNDPLFSQQWGLSGATASVNAPQAWCASTGSGVLVADVDTGANFGHEDLSGRLVAGAAFTGGNGSVTGSGQAAVDDGYGHGTMTAGLVVANKDNGLGIAGVAPSATALIVKVFANDGTGTTTDAGAGIKWAADHGALAINASFGSDLAGLGVPNPLDTNISNAVVYATQHGAMVALAAGNSSLPASEYQRVSNVALVVGALTRDGTAASYSTSGVGVNIWAPGGDGSGGGSGVDVVSTYIGAPDAYRSAAGTSFAAPHVTGTLALLIARGYSPSAARQRILSTAVTRNGLPELDAAAALGTSGGCASAPATTNNPSASVRPNAGRPPAITGPGAAAQTPSTSVSAGSSPSPTPLVAVVPSGGADALHGKPAVESPPRRPGIPTPVIGVFALIGAGAGFGGAAAAVRYLARRA